MVSWRVDWGAEIFPFLICLLELKDVWEIFSQPQKNSLHTGRISYWMWNESQLMKERFYVSIKKHRRSSRKAQYHWVLYQYIENTCAFLLAGSHKIQGVLSLASEREALLCIYSSLVQPVTGSRTLTQRVREARSLLVTEHPVNPFTSTEGPQDASAKSCLTSFKFGRTAIMSFLFYLHPC